METSKLEANANEKNSDGLPTLLSLCDMQSAIASAYSEILCSLAQKLAGAKGKNAEALAIVFDRLRHDAPWAVTEVHSKAEFKIRRQRYISQDVFDFWQILHREAKPTLGSYTKDDNGATLCHEHVVQRRGISQRLSAANQHDELRRVLSESIACIVSRKEDKRLRNTTGLEGWARYENAKAGRVGVYDRKHCRWVVERS